MFSTFFARLLAPFMGTKSGGNRPRNTKSGAKLVHKPVAAAAAVAMPSSNRPPVATSSGVGARRPLIATNGDLAGFEFYVSMTPRMRGQDDAATRSYASNVLGAMRLCAAQGMVALARMPTAWLSRFQGEDAVYANGMFVPGMYIVLDTNPEKDNLELIEPLIARLRETGVQLGWTPAKTEKDYAPPGKPDFVIMHSPLTPTPLAWKMAIDASASRLPDVKHVLLDLPDIDVMESVMKAPVTLAACSIGKSMAPTKMQALPPQARHLLRLLSRLIRDDDTALIAKDIKSDAALSLRLLHYLNSAGASPGRELESIDQAVTVLGRDTLYAWVSQMLVKMSTSRPAAAGLQALALARARLLERLSWAAGEPSPGTFYLLGLASMLPTLLQCSVDDALDSLPLPPLALEAIRSESGPWYRYLAIAQALEKNDITAAEKLSGPFGGIDAVMAHSAHAWSLC